MTQIPGPIVATNRFLRAFMEGLATFGEPVTDYPVGANALRTIAAKVTPAAPTKDREDHFGTPTPQTPIDLKRTAQASWSGYLLPNGDSAVNPDPDPEVAELFENAGFTKNDGTSTTVQGAGSTTSVIDVTSAADIQIGDVVLINGEAAIVTARDVVPVPDQITIAPPLSAAPANTDDVYVGKAYTLKDARDTTPDSLALWVSVNRVLMRALGWVPTQISLEFGGDDAAKISAEGPAQRGDILSTTTIDDAGGIIAGDLVVIVANSRAVPDDVATNPVYVEIINSVNGNEVVRVTAVDHATRTWTIVRAQLATAAVAHADGLTIVPHVPTATFTGTPVPSTAGKIVLVDDDSNRRELQLTTATIDIGLPITERVDEHGTEYKLQGYTQRRREIALNLVGWAHNLTMEQVVRALRRQTPAVLVQQGNTVGETVGVYAPSVLFEVPDLDPSQEEMTVELSGKALGTTVGGDELIVFLV